MRRSNTRNIINTLSLTFMMILFSTTLFSQNDSIKKKKKIFNPFLDASKKADGIQIAIPDKINPIFDLNRKTSCKISARPNKPPTRQPAIL